MATSITGPTLAPDSVAVPPRRRRLWLWFLGGFLIVFIGMPIAVTTFYMHPSGEAVVQCKLWEYYFVQIPRMFRSQHLGPATGDSQAAVTVLLQHLACSAIGGMAALGIRWGVYKLKPPKTPPSIAETTR